MQNQMKHGTNRTVLTPPPRTEGLKPATNSEVQTGNASDLEIAGAGQLANPELCWTIYSYCCFWSPEELIQHFPARTWSRRCTKHEQHRCAKRGSVVHFLHTSKECTPRSPLAQQAGNWAERKKCWDGQCKPCKPQQLQELWSPEKRQVFGIKRRLVDLFVAHVFCFRLTDIKVSRWTNEAT